MYTGLDGTLDELPIAERSGYVMRGWFYGEGTSQQFTVDTLARSNMKVYAAWDQVKPTTVTVVPSSVEVAIGTTFPLKVETDPYSGSTVTWTTSDSKVVNVSSDGVLVPVHEGSATVTATVEGVSGTCSVTVVNKSVYKITFDANGGICDVDYMYTDSTQHLQSLPDATRFSHAFDGWYTSNSGGTKVTTDYRFSGDKTVYAHWAPIPVEDVTLSRDNVSTYEGMTFKLRATVMPLDATVKTVTWASSDPAVITVDDDGLIKAVGIGTATITVKTDDGDKTATCSVSVVSPVGVLLRVDFDAGEGTSEVESLTVLADGHLPYLPDAYRESYRFAGWFTEPEGGEQIIVDETVFVKSRTVVYAHWDIIPLEKVITFPTSMNLLVGTASKIGCTVVPVDATFGQVTWSSSDPSIATVDQEGIVTARAAGKVTITASAGDLSATCVVTVRDVDELVIAILDESSPVAVITNLDEIHTKIIEIQQR